MKQDTIWAPRRRWRPKVRRDDLGAEIKHFRFRLCAYLVCSSRDYYAPKNWPTASKRVVDAAMPGKADGQNRKPTFNTTEREESFKNPPKHASTYPILNEFVTPHIESFNALFDDSGLPKGDGDGKGLLSIALKDIGERVVFDGTGQIGTESGQAGWGNRLSGELTTSMQRFAS